MNFFTIKRVLILGVIVAAVICLLPTFTNTWPHKKINLGLDLQGGMHLVLEVQSEEAVKTELDRTISQLKLDLKNEKIQLEQVRQSLSSKMINAIRNVQARAKQAALADKAAALARQKMDIEQEKLRYGRSSSFQVILFENDLRAAENNRLNARMNYLNTQVELLLATGTLVDQWNLRLISQAEIRALLEGQGDEID